MSARILLHVQHLLGTGHLKRAAALAHALADDAHEVVLASGGPPIAGLDTGAARLVQLPPLRAADATFRRLVDAQGRPVDDAWKAARRAALLRLFESTRPDVLITELFPFGRRMLEFELEPLLDAARARRPRPLILCSLRDVLVAPREPVKVARAVERARRLYDRVLVHGDPALIDLPASYPAAHELRDLVAYTGYVRSPPGPDAPPGDGEDEVIVSAGGGAVGARLLETAAAAQRQPGNARPWRLLVGADVPAEGRERLLAAATPRLIVEPARRDFASLLRRCHASISQAGYNTVMDVLDAAAPAVLVPFAAAGETEQTARALALAARGWADVLSESELAPDTLAAAVTRAGARPRPDTSGLQRDGAAVTARLVGELLAARRVSA